MVEGVWGRREKYMCAFTVMSGEEGLLRGRVEERR